MADSPEVMVEHYESLKREEIKLSKESLEKFKQRYTDFGKLHWMDAQEIVVELERVQSELTEKDATIEKLQDMSQRWKKAFTNADKQYLKKEKEAAELRRMIEGRDEQLGIALDEAKRLRKALEEAYTDMMDALQVMEMEKRDFSLMPQCTIKDAAAKLGKLLYPAGEDDTQKVTVTLHNRGYEKHELDFGEGDKE